jgi:TRAP transporter TAXI family solute receptor
LSISFDFVPPLARSGKKPFPEKITDTRGILLFATSFTHVIVTKDSGVTGIDQLKGKKFATQPVGTGSQYAFATLLTANGLSEKDLKLFVGGQSYGSNQIKDRNTVGMTATTAFPGGTISELFTTIGMRFLDVGDAVYEKVQKINPGLVRVTLPAKMYRGQTEPVKGIGTGSVLVTSAAQPEEEIYWITKTLVENLDALKKVHASLKGMTKESIVKLGGCPLHPGAERYYKEIGVIK